MMNKKTLLLLISLSTILFSCANRYMQEDISCLQIIDRNGLSETISAQEKLNQYKNIDFDQPQSYQKVLRIYNKDNNGNTFSKLTCYHENGQPWKSLEIKNARAYGKYMEWYSNGNLKIESFVIGGAPDFSLQKDWLFDGSCKAYNQNGTLMSEFNYVKGFLQGEAKYYYSSSQPKKVIPYLNNEIDGEVIEYTKTNDCLSKTSYKNGIKDGPSIGYWSKDNISFMEDYENDLLINGQYFKKSRVKISKIKNGDGQKAIFKKDSLHKLIEYKNGKPQGKIQTYSTSGQLLNEYFQKNGIKDGLETEYYNQNEVTIFNKKKPHPKLEIDWDNGNIHGFVKTWYKNGKQESQKEYSQNKKNGLHLAWFENGSIMFVEEYENDLLMKGRYFKINEEQSISTIIKGNGTASLFDSKGRFIKKVTYKEGSPIQ